MAEAARAWELPNPRDAVLVVNTGSRRGAGRLDPAVARLRDLGVQVRDVRCARRSHDVRRAIEAALAEGVPEIVVGGGDGTLSLAANLLAGTGVVLGVLPLGTGNDLARDLSIPLDLPGACRVLAEGRVDHVDLGCINGRYFTTTISIGFTAHAAHHILPWAKRLLGRPAYLLAAARAFAGYEGFRSRVTVDGRTEEYDALQLIVGNGRFHSAGTPLSPGASIHDGRLVYYAFAGLSRWQMLKMAWLVYRGRHIYHRRSHFAYAQRIELETEPSQPILVDGERQGRTPATIRVVPGALAVIVP